MPKCLGARGCWCFVLKIKGKIKTFQVIHVLALLKVRLTWKNAKDTDTVVLSLWGEQELSKFCNGYWGRARPTRTLRLHLRGRWLGIQKPTEQSCYSENGSVSVTWNEKSTFSFYIDYSLYSSLSFSHLLNFVCLSTALPSLVFSGTLQEMLTGPSKQEIGDGMASWLRCRRI